MGRLIAFNFITINGYNKGQKEILAGIHTTRKKGVNMPWKDSGQAIPFFLGGLLMR